MNIRQHLNRRFLPIYGTMVVCLVLFAGGGLLAPQAQWSFIVVMLGFVGFGACIVYLHYGIRCPKCRNALGYLAFLPKGGYFHLSEKICYCPFCGTNLDTEVGGKLASRSGEN